MVSYKNNCVTYYNYTRIMVVKVSASARQDADNRHLCSVAAFQSSFTLTHSLISSIFPDTDAYIYSRVVADCRVQAAALVGLI